MFICEEIKDLNPGKGGGQFEIFSRTASCPRITGLGTSGLEGPRETTEHLSQDSRCSGRDSNPLPPEHKSETLTRDTPSSIPLCKFIGLRTGERGSQEIGPHLSVSLKYIFYRLQYIV
jgi:hypothetical protein